MFRKTSLELRPTDGPQYRNLSPARAHDFKQPCDAVYDSIQEPRNYETVDSHNLPTTVSNVNYTLPRPAAAPPNVYEHSKPPPPPPPPPSHPSDEEFCKVDPSISLQNTQGPVTQQKLVSKTRHRKSSCIVVLAVIFIAASFLLSCASLSFAFIVYNTRQQETTAMLQGQQKEDNLTTSDNAKIESDIMNLSRSLARLDTFEAGLNALRSQVSNVLQAVNTTDTTTTTAAASTTPTTNPTNSLSFRISTLESMLNNLSWTHLQDVSSIRGDTNLLRSQFNTVSSSYNSLNARHRREMDSALASINSVRSQSSSTQRSLSSVRSQSSSTQRSLSSLQSRLRSVNLYSSCREYTYSCNVIPHENNDRWYYCSTRSTSLNLNGFYTVSIQCEYQTTRGYIDSAIIQLTGTSVRCQCDVVGLNSLGQHTPYNSARLPSGVCRLRVRRCPTSVNIA